MAKGRPKANVAPTGVSGSRTKLPNGKPRPNTKGFYGGKKKEK